MKQTFKWAGLPLVGLMFSPLALAQQNSLELPTTLAWSAYDVGSAGYNQADAVFGSSIAGKAYALEKSNRGITYPVMDPDDKEGWARTLAVGPFFYPLLATEGAGLSDAEPVNSSAYPYPILMTYADRDNTLVTKVTNAMIDTFDLYKDSAPGSDGWALDKQRLDWVVPLHDGAINVYKAKGMWNEDLQKNQDAVVKRQEILEAAWKDVNSRSHDSDEAFEKDWMKTRADALKSAGLDPILESW